MKLAHRLLFAAALLSVGLIPAEARWCPFCSAVQQTFAEQMATSDVVVLAELVRLVEEPVSDDQLPKAVFRVTEVVKGKADLIAPGYEFPSIYVGQPAVGQVSLLMGVDPPNFAWTTPLKMSDEAVEYLRAIPSLPERGVDRLRFFQKYFEHPESMLAFDAYEEFARASYAEVVELKPHMDRDKLRGWLQDPDVSTNRKRLYFTLLGVCGTDEDLPMLESMIASAESESRRGLDAMIACYLTLKGESGLELIESEFFEDPQAEYVDTFAAVSAIRFLVTERADFSRTRVLQSLHKVLDRPTLADLVIPDLARWEDWSVIDKMVELFKNSTEETKWVRVPVVSYLKVCPKPEAQQAIEELKKIDPESVRRAETLLRWESGEDEFEEDEADGESVDDSSDGAEEMSPDDDGDQPSVGDDGDPSINVPVYEVRRLPTGSSDATPTSHPVQPRAQGRFVSAGATVGAPSSAETSDQTADQPPTLVAAAPGGGWSWAVVLGPAASCMVLFLLLWSVLSGWFERLIY
jgi:hypothetical protein